MARRYVRDNRGRFATVGATARGGRLRTASGGKRATQTGRIKGAVPSGTIRSGRRNAKPAAAAAPASGKSALARTGKRVALPTMRTNLERGRRGVVSMSKGAKQARSGAVAERKAEKIARVNERQSEIVARRQGSRLSTYTTSGQFNQAAATLNQRKEKRSRQLQSWLTTRDPASKPAKARK